MSVREYIGARYVPIFADPIDWDSTKTYEPLTIVYYQGNSYTSKQSVPAGINITNESYWAETGNYNAQIEAYRQEVQAYNSRIEAMEEGLPVTDFDSTSTVSDAIDSLNTSINSIEDALPISEFDSTNTVDARFDAIEANNWVTETRIANNAVTENKIADGAVTENKIANSSVSTAKIADGSVTKAKLGNGIRFSGTKFLTFGDSWIAHANKTLVSGCWVNDVADFLNLTNENYARGGAKLSTTDTGGMSLYTQVQEAIAAIPSANVGDYEYIFIMGGVNDYNDNSITESGYQTGLLAALNLMKSHFTQSKIIVIALNCFWSVYGATARFGNMCECTRNACMDANVSCMSGLTGWFRLFGQSVYRPNDDSSYSAAGGTYHPNNRGNKRIAQFIISLLTGQRPKIFIPLTAISPFTITQNSSWSDGINIYWNFAIQIPQNTSVSAFQEVAKSEWDNYTMAIQDLGDANMPTPPINALTGQNNALSHNMCFFTRAMNYTNCSISAYWSGSLTEGAYDVKIVGCTPIMRQ